MRVKNYIIAGAIVLSVLLLSAYQKLQAQDYHLNFDGTEYIDLDRPSAIEIDTDVDAFSISCWFRVSAGNKGMFVAKGYGSGSTHHEFSLGYSGNDLVFAEVGGVRIDGLKNLHDDGHWHHACVTSDGTDFILYIDGIQESAGLCGTVDEPDIDWLIGGRRETSANNDLGFALTGDVDEVRFWNIELDPTQVISDMFNELASPGSNADLNAYYTMSDGSGTTLSDNDATSDGTISSSGTWVSAGTSPLGDAYQYALGNANISENASVEVDISMSGVSTSYAYSAIQINSTPTNTSNLLAEVATFYWELWGSNYNFDNSYSATVHFHYDNIASITDESELKLYRRDNDNSASWTEVTSYTINDGGDNTDGEGYISLTITQATSWDFNEQYIITSDDSDDNSFAISLLDFTTEVSESNTQLLWTTASELDNDFFTLERSYDGKSFESIARVNGNGSSDHAIHYSFIDYSRVSNKDAYYRLSHTDFNAHTEVAKVIKSEAFQSIELEVNVQNKQLLVTAFESEAFMLYTLDGKLISVGVTNSTVNLNHLQKGVYILRIVSEKPYKTHKILLSE